MTKLIDLIGQRFGRLVVVERGLNSNRGTAQWYCDCDCGTKRKLISGLVLRRGNTKSCGCLKMDLLRARLTKHKHAVKNGMSATYRIWLSMNQRCNNPNDADYRFYGGRGIKVHPDWINTNPQGFENFLACMGECLKGYSLDRKSNDGDYCPGNCRWTTRKEQARNRRNNRLVEYNGEIKTLAEWAEELGIKYTTLSRRINGLGWSIERAFTTPVHSN